MSIRSTRKLALLVTAAALGIALAYRPWMVYREQRAQTEMTQRQLRDAERASAQLIRDKARLETPAARERMAREQGFIKPGEQPVNR